MVFDAIGPRPGPRGPGPGAGPRAPSTGLRGQTPPGIRRDAGPDSLARRDLREAAPRQGQDVGGGEGEELT